MIYLGFDVLDRGGELRSFRCLHTVGEFGTFGHTGLSNFDDVDEENAINISFYIRPKTNTPHRPT